MEYNACFKILTDCLERAVLISLIFLLFSVCPQPQLRWKMTNVSLSFCWIQRTWEFLWTLTFYFIELKALCSGCAQACPFNETLGPNTFIIKKSNNESVMRPQKEGGRLIHVREQKTIPPPRTMNTNFLYSPWSHPLNFLNTFLFSSWQPYTKPKWEEFKLTLQLEISITFTGMAMMMNTLNTDPQSSARSCWIIKD